MPNTPDQSVRERFEKSVRAKFKNSMNAGAFYSEEDVISCEKIENFFLSFIDTEIQRAVADTEKAFGGCKACYGKGYATQMLVENVADDFGTEGYMTAPFVRMNYCKCARGKQLKALLTPNKNL